MPCPPRWQPNLAHLSHELRTHLHGILGLIGWLGTSRLPVAQQAMVRRLEAGGRSLLALANTLIESRDDAKKHPVAFVPAEVTEDLAALLAPLAEQRGVELVCAADPECHVVMGDPEQFRHLVANLIGNAVKFTERGHILVQLDARREGTRIRLQLSVADTGVGIAARDRRRIFRAGEQVRPSEGGSGLGLSIALAAARALGGELHLRSRLGTGSTFSIQLTLPASETPKLAVPRARPCIIVGGLPAQRRWLARHFLRWNLPCAEATPENLPRIREAFRRATGERPLVLVDVPVGTRALPVRAPDTIILHPLGLNPRQRSALAKPLRGSELRALLSPAPTATRRNVAAHAWRILIVDDDATSRSITARQLERRGHHTAKAETGRRALQKLRCSKTDLVILDLNLPDTPGLELAVTLQQTHPGLPLLALTAQGGAKVRAQCLRAGFSGQLTKPVDATTLIEAVEKMAEDGEDACDRRHARTILLRRAKAECLGLDEASRSGQSEVIGQAAHRTRGALAAAGLSDLARLAAQAEREAQNGKTAAAARTLGKVSGGLRRLADGLTS